MNKVGNCPVCGRLYVDTGIRMCRDCYTKELETEEVIARYVRDHQKSTVKEICEGTGAKEKTVFRMIRNGRFIESGVEVAYPCESCGTPILKGRLCEKCSANIMKQVYDREKKNSAENKKPLDIRDKSRGMYTKNMGSDDRFK